VLFLLTAEYVNGIVLDVVGGETNSTSCSELSFQPVLLRDRVFHPLGRVPPSAATRRFHGCLPSW
jgi:hypothetical protein